MQINLLLSIAIIFFFKFFKNFFLSIIKTIKKKPLVKKYFSLLTRILSVQSSNGIAILFYKNPVICKKSKFQRKSKKKKKKKTFDLVPIKKYIFSRNETKPRNLSPFTRSIRAIFSLPPPLFYFSPSWDASTISIVGLAGLISYRLIECPSGQDPL